MNVNPFSKKSAVVAKPVKGASPLNDIGDVSAVTEMFKRLRQQNAQYDQAIAALVAANRITCGWDKPAEPEMTLTIQRDVLAALGDADALAKFDQEHQQALAQEQAARVKATQQVQEAPTRVKALEQYLNELAGQMVAELDETLIDQEIRRIFQPSAQRMLEAAKTFVQAWREMQSVEAVLFPRTLQQAGSLFVDDAPVLARGRLNIREDRANSLLIDEIKPLGEVNRNVYIRFDTLPEDEMQRTCSFLKRYSGETPVVLYDAAKKLGKGVPKEYYVAVTDAFLAAAEDRFGKECIKLK